MFKREVPKETKVDLGQFPHCDQRILHAPGECVYCDRHPEWQALREAWGIAFTGYQPEGKELPCPADNARGDSHKLWHGNIAQPKDKPEPYLSRVCPSHCGALVYSDEQGLLHNEEDDLLHSCRTKN